MAFEAPRWSDRIVVEEFGGVPHRIYAERPHRVEQVLALADRWGERAHLIQDERSVSFAGLRRAASAKARELLESGVGRGQRVMLLGWNSPDWVVNFWACVQIGAVPVLANAWWGESEIGYALDLLQPALVLADASTRDRMARPWRLGRWAAAEDAGAQDVAPAPDMNAALPGEGETAVIVFTSGSEGQAKAVELSHRALLCGLQMMLHITRQLPLRFNEARSEVALHTGPLFHVGGPQAMLRSVAVGNTLVFPSGRFDPQEVLRLIEQRKVSRWTAVPTMIGRVLDHPDVHTRDLRSLRSIGTGGTPVSPLLLERIRTGLPEAQVSIAIGYGLTENTGPATTASGTDTLEHPGTCGRPLPCVEIRVAPRAGVPDGEVLVRSPTLMSGYFGIDASPIDREGWLHTGDLGRTDETGRLWITGRSKDLIIRGGENIAPAAVERALGALAQVADAAVVGVPNADVGEEVFAFVVLKAPATPEQLQAALRPALASFAVPTRWCLQDEPLPTNQTGKIDKLWLKARAKALVLPPTQTP
jgi:acyl-CoA synthetase (AMP-forming)/AMP-acid ligase II